MRNDFSYRIAETFANLEGLWVFMKVFSMKFGGVVSFGGTSKQSAEVFSSKIFFPPIHESFPQYYVKSAFSISLPYIRNRTRVTVQASQGPRQDNVIT